MKYTCYEVGLSMVKNEWILFYRNSGIIDFDEYPDSVIWWNDMIKTGVISADV